MEEKLLTGTHRDSRMFVNKEKCPQPAVSALSLPKAHASVGVAADSWGRQSLRKPFPRDHSIGGERGQGQLSGPCGYEINPGLQVWEAIFLSRFKSAFFLSRFSEVRSSYSLCRHRTLCASHPTERALARHLTNQVFFVKIISKFHQLWDWGKITQHSEYFFQFSIVK